MFVFTLDRFALQKNIFTIQRNCGETVTDIQNTEIAICMLQIYKDIFLVLTQVNMANRHSKIYMKTEFIVQINCLLLHEMHTRKTHTKR